MSRWLRYGLLLLALCGGVACAGTETGNPDPSTPRDDGGPPSATDAGSVPSQDAASAYDAGALQDAGNADTGTGPDDDGGTQDRDMDAGD